MKEFTQRCAAAPAGHSRGLNMFGLMKPADHGRQHMAAGGVIIVAWPIKIGWH